MASNNGIKVSKEGYDVRIAANTDLNLSSSVNTFKQSMIGSGTVSATSTTTITHNLGYRPMFLVYMESYVNAGKMHLMTSEKAVHRGTVSCSTTELKIQNTHTGDRLYYYYIMYDTI